MRKRLCLLIGGSGFFGSAFIRRYAATYKIIAVHRHGEIRFASQDQWFVDPLSPSRALEINDHAVHAIRADVSNPAEIERLVREVVDDFGIIDVLVNAATARSSSALLASNALNRARGIFDVNVLAPLRLSVALAQSMWQLDPGANLRANRNIVNVSSTAGLAVYEDLGLSVYAASAAALNHLTYYLASEFWDIGLRVNAVALDLVANDSIDAAVAIVADFDASDQTGQVLPLYRNGPLAARANAEPVR
jgi:NAD(P)-dependent dehydrogenase (short-subunit alcohol dehydrogenase family)